MTRLRIHPEAAAELEQAFAFYEEQSAGLGAEFLDEIERKWLDIRSMPLAASPVDEGVRKSVLRRFPFVVFYEVQPDQVIVWAVAHQRRRPRYWQSRRRSETGRGL